MAGCGTGGQWATVLATVLGLGLALGTARPAAAAPGPDTAHWLVGAAAPQPALTTLDGAPADAPWAAGGGVVVVWAGWCGPCVAELPVVAQAVEAAGAAGRPVTLLSVDDERAVARRALARTVPRDPGWALRWGGPAAAGAFAVRTLPTAVVVGADGRVVSVWTGHQGRRDWRRLVTPAAAPPAETAAPAPRLPPAPAP